MNTTGSVWRRLATDLGVSSAASGGRDVVRSVVYLLPVMIVALVLYRDLYSGTAVPTGTAHPEQSINVALNAHFCGQPRAISQRHSVQVFLTTRLDLMSHAFREVIATQAGSIAAYCRTVNDPVIVSENSLMWMARLALRLNPDLTPDGLGRFLGASRVLMLLVFGFALLRTGASVLLTLAAVLVGCAILRALGVRDSIYPFVLSLPLLHAGVYGVARSSRFVMDRRQGLWVFALAMGALTAFSASMRTIHLPMCAAMFGVFLLAAFKHDAESGALDRRAKTIGAAAAMFVVGYALHTALLVYPLRLPADPNVSSYTYHTLAHQLVLGLAIPESDLSRREGIQWNDEVGFAIARRVRPDVTYIGPHYETALLKYYGSLWRKYPGEMAAVYFQKLRSTGSEVFLSAALIGAEFGVPRGPAEWLHRVTNGLVLVAAGLFAFVVSLRRHIRTGSSRLLIVALVSLAALASLGEAFLTYSLFVGLYYSSLLFFVFFAFLVSAQAVVDLVARSAFGINPSVQCQPRVA